MTFFIRWVIRFFALGTLIGLPMVWGLSRALLTPQPYSRIYPNEILEATYPLASQNVSTSLNKFMKSMPRVTRYALDINEIQVNALLIGAFKNSGIPLLASRIFLDADTVTLILKLDLLDLQKHSPDPKLRNLVLPWPFDDFRKEPITLYFKGKLAFDDRIHHFQISDLALYIGQVDVGNMPAALWATPVGRIIIQSIAMSMGMSSVVGVKIATTAPSLDLVASSIQQKLNDELDFLQKEGYLVVDDFALQPKRISFILAAGSKVTDELKNIDKFRSNPVYYSQVREKLLKGELTPGDCKTARLTMERLHKKPLKSLSPEDKEAYELMEKAVTGKDAVCNKPRVSVGSDGG